MPKVPITLDILTKAVEQIVREKSFGNASMKITGIEGVAENGESFPITGIRVAAHRADPNDLAPKPSTPAGKLRLAAVDGEAL